jgi:hypothetical protein
MYVYFSDLPEHEGLASERDAFTDVVPTRPTLAEVQVALIVFAGEEAVGGCARIRRRGKAVSYKWRVRFDEFVEFDEPIGFAELIERIGQSAAREFGSLVERGGGSLSAEAGRSVLDALKELRPETADALDRLAQISSRPPTARRSEGEPVVEYERDAVGLALEFAGLSDERSSVLRSWEGDTTEPFLVGISDYAVLEDRMIDHDAQVFGGWELLEGSVVGISRFERRDRRVTVINVNRSGIEKSLGVDLIYYSSHHRAYVIVQYKRMEKGTDKDWTFRPDAQLDDELARVRALVPASDVVSSPAEYRLDPACGYLKICSRIVADPFSDALMPGIYLPLAYWDVLAASGSLTGPRAGRLLTHERAERWIHNTLFIDLVQAAWVGSRGATTEQITEIIRSGLDAQRSLILARASRPSDDAAVSEETPRFSALRDLVEDGS